MNYVWHQDGISICSVSMNRWDDMQMWTSGIGWIDEQLINGAHTKRPFQWEASALSTGWYIIITTGLGKVGEYQGTTFNLPLEIATAAKRLL